MPTLTIPESTYDVLVKAAAARRVAPEALAAATLDQLAPAEPPGPPSREEWLRDFDAWIAEIRARPPLYPPGHVVDVSRESIYEGCGE